MAQPIVDQDTCIGCGVCVELCPEVFELRDDGKSWVIDPDQCHTCDCEDAAASCPVSAIEIR